MPNINANFTLLLNGLPITTAAINTHTIADVCNCIANNTIKTNVMYFQIFLSINNGQAIITIEAATICLNPLFVSMYEIQ